MPSLLQKRGIVTKRTDQARKTAIHAARARALQELRRRHKKEYQTLYAEELEYEGIELRYSHGGNKSGSIWRR